MIDPNLSSRAVRPSTQFEFGFGCNDRKMPTDQLGSGQQSRAPSSQNHEEACLAWASRPCREAFCLERLLAAACEVPCWPLHSGDWRQFFARITSATCRATTRGALRIRSDIGHRTCPTTYQRRSISRNVSLQRFRPTRAYSRLTHNGRRKPGRRARLQGLRGHNHRVTTVPRRRLRVSWCPRLASLLWRLRHATAIETDPLELQAEGSSVCLALDFSGTSPKVGSS